MPSVSYPRQPHHHQYFLQLSHPQNVIRLSRHRLSSVPPSESDTMDTSASSGSTTSTTDSQNDPDNTSAEEQPHEQNLDYSEVQSLHQPLHQSLTLPNTIYLDGCQWSALTSICLCKISAVPTVSTQPIVITHYLTVNADLAWSPLVHNHKFMQQNCPALQSIPQILTSDSLRDLLQLLDRLHVCCGQPDSHYISMVNAKKGKIISSDGNVAAMFVLQVLP